VKASCSMFSPFVELTLPMGFEAVVKKHKTECAAKGLSSWAQVVATLPCQLGRAHARREFEGRSTNCKGALAHLGIEAPARATAPDARTHRTACPVEPTSWLPRR
jgi:hypothetical protein